jgi:2-(1,2-epoxy-1,2-dihydrophenyl)acetyl-CoA isomerase
MTYETLGFELDGNVATITFDRPDSANTLNGTMAKELNDVSIVCDEDPTIRAVILRGNSRFFCAGGDLSDFLAQENNISAIIKVTAADLHLAISRFSRMQAPVIAAVRGTAAGAGLSLAGLADLVVAGRSANFVMAYTAAGLSPDGSSTYFLPRRIGFGRTRELMLTNRVLNADEALDWGLVNQVVDDDEVLEASRKLASTLASGPSRAYAAVKRLLDTSMSNGLETQMELEARSIAEMAASEDGKEGIRAFLEKRKPRFTGR